MKKINRLSVISATIGLTGLLLSGCSPDHGMAAVYGPEIEASTEEEVEYSEDVSSSYYTYEWTKDKGLTLFRSGYGAEGEPIEISLKG